MKYIKQLFAMATLCLSLNTLALEANTADSQLLSLQKSWAAANYQSEGKAQVAAFESLLIKAEQLTEEFPQNASVWVWRGIVESSFAGAKGGLGALSLAKAARRSLEKSITLDDSALNGSAYTSLGTLYHKVPGWPIGFGDDKKAKLMLTKALEINPEGIDPNYFYGEFLYDDKEYSLAKTYLEKAKQAEPRSSRPLADQYRHQEIDALLAKVTKKMSR